MTENADMNFIEVPFLDIANKETPLQDISHLLDDLPRNDIAQVPWPRFSYKPAASFSIGHSNDCIFIKYYISENFVKADFHQTNEPVYKDSCVEFFISFGEDKKYYNFEFNCAGTCLSGFGSGKDDRQLLRKNVIDHIRRQTLLRRDNDEDQEPSIYWEITIAFPLEAFCFHDLHSLKGQLCRINFYKCGDDLPEPHFLSWAPIYAEEPNFHRSEFFGTMTFC